jgi:hypothetical protein
MLNIPEVDSYDLPIYRNNRSQLIDRLKKICRDNSISFLTNHDPLQLHFKNKKGVMFWPGDLIKDLEHWKKLDKHYKQIGFTLFVFTDNFIEFGDLEHVKFYSDPTLHFLFCSYRPEDISVNENPSKLYNCFIQRVESVRQSWFYFLYLRNLLDKGYVSFLCKQLTSYSTLTGADLFDYIHKEYNLDDVPEFSKAHSELRSIVPYRNFVENHNLPFYIKDSKYSLVLETYATNYSTDRWLIGEKAIRALCFPSIPLLFMQTRAVEKLKSIGFQIDYHDQIDNMSWIDKQCTLLDIIENDAIDITPKQNYNRAVHNCEIGLAAKQRCLRNNYFDEFITKVLTH